MTPESFQFCRLHIKHEIAKGTAKNLIGLTIMIVAVRVSFFKAVLLANKLTMMLIFHERQTICVFLGRNAAHRLLAVALV